MIFQRAETTRKDISIAMTSVKPDTFGAKESKERKVKCVVWDLDNTLWEGVLLEGDKLSPRQNVFKIIKALDDRGILQSIASKNDHTKAMEKLREFEVEQYFLYPQINWNSKSSSIENIAKSINIGIDTIAFIDDQAFEREEVNYSLPDVLCIDAIDLDAMLDMPEMNPRFVTDETKKRRQMYLSDIRRNNDEAEYTGPKEEFLASLNMAFTIARAREEDLKRAEELTVRTNQLNTTGYTYSYEDLDAFRKSPSHRLLIAGLEDKYGSYGKIGLALIECHENVWTLKLLLMSCRVMSRGVGAILINHILKLAKDNNVTLRAEFVSNDRNRMMYVTFKFAGFKEISRQGDMVLLENDLNHIQPFPNYVDIQIKE